MHSHIKPQNLQSPLPGIKNRLRTVGAIMLPALLAGTLLASDDSDRLTFGWLRGADWRGKAEVAVY
ncbi:MAG: hypothetical protein KDK34_06530, partial [Leptospiraceae bacterium]|nr:hypothetical protein [Leptospiraceae bacterium]